MTLDITPTERNRLSVHLKNSTLLGKSQLPPEKEALIVKALKEKHSTRDIKQRYNTSYETIAKIRKKYGMWGA